jgi:hypothetical protein
MREGCGLPSMMSLSNKGHWGYYIVYMAHPFTYLPVTCGVQKGRFIIKYLFVFLRLWIVVVSYVVKV